MGRIIKFIWIISLLTGLAVLLYTYASLGETVVYSSGDSETGSVTREMFFYIGLGVLVIFNFTFYAISRNMHLGHAPLKQALINWQLSFASCLNFFFIVGILFLMLYNSGENFNFNNFGYLVYISLAAIILWIIALPVVILKNRPVSSTIK